MHRNLAETVARLTGGEYFKFENTRSLERGLITISNQIPNSDQLQGPGLVERSAVSPNQLLQSTSPVTALSRLRRLLENKQTARPDSYSSIHH